MRTYTRGKGTRAQHTTTVTRTGSKFFITTTIKKQPEKRVGKRNLIEEMKIILALQTQNRQFKHRRIETSTTKNKKEGKMERQISCVSKFRTRRGPNDRLRV